MKKISLGLALLCVAQTSGSWGFYGHRHINRVAVYLLPPEMLFLFKPQVAFLTEHAVDPDKRRYAVKEEAPRHFIDIDHYGAYPFDSLPRKWKDACAKFSEDTIQRYGIVPWWLQTMLHRLTDAFREKDKLRILRYAAELGHYMADAHVPLHAHSNHNGQYTNQKGIHGFWESRVPELLAEKEWDFFIGHADYIADPAAFIWDRVLESAAAVDSVLRFEKELDRTFSHSQKFAYEERNGVITRQYSTAYTKAYDAKLNGMVERRMRASIYAVASFWYTAWVNAGQPDLSKLIERPLSPGEIQALNEMNAAWQKRNNPTEEHELPLP
jgi:hypothetical protein